VRASNGKGGGKGSGLERERAVFCPAAPPSCTMDLMLNPCVGVVVVMSSSLSLRRMVVLPALSRPRIRMRAYISGKRGEGEREAVREL
jgi:hypothetical protein